ncbi:hypothetical protein CLOLEP_00646 [[Clostridium] leptum DSM 753]|uniref:Uncharacterized protein n=1 Tax=[Clostridium] leptum DSM 753 TaxID=428125 RepID=A7VQ19_9FIRM|nr:hypothetical protein CLOLEP_00646 [[Clostridium] leptum DSM 753]
MRRYFTLNIGSEWRAFPRFPQNISHMKNTEYTKKPGALTAFQAYSKPQKLSSGRNC